jgi:hypothetical protein
MTFGTSLDWVAVDHWNTDNPHIHVLVRGRADDGQDLVISRDYISQGFRSRAAERITLELGPRSEQEIPLDWRGRSMPSVGLASTNRSATFPTRAVGSPTFAPAASAKIPSFAG